MAVEANSDGEPDCVTRARRYAALGEPSRLAVVDALVLGDASPGELTALVGLPTNLMAHHLRVLDEAGLIRRVRSEGDRRRSYVQLRLDDPEVAALLGGAPAHADATRVVFVCTRNSARSQLAAAAWSRISEVPATSAGTHPAERVHPLAVAAGLRNGLLVGRAQPQQLADVVEPGDLLVAVCDSAHEQLSGSTSAAVPPRWLHWSVPDPVRIGTNEAFETAFDVLRARVTHLASAMSGAR